jgi:phosphoglycolate phosphatase-like HAD superfamily hydrolase
VDVRTARNAGIAVWGVLYGFQPESFVEDPPDRTLARPEELARAAIAERNSRGASKS